MAPAPAFSHPSLAELAPDVEDSIGHTPLDRVMHDGVLQALVGDGQITLAQAVAAVRASQAHASETDAWRFLVGQQGIDLDAVAQTVANVAGFPVVDLSAANPVMIQAIFALFPDELADRLRALGLVPLGLDEDEEGHRLRLVCPDPTNDAVQGLLASIEVPLRLGFAPASAVGAVLEAVETLRQARSEAPAPVAPPPESDAEAAALPGAAQSVTEGAAADPPPMPQDDAPVVFVQPVRDRVVKAMLRHETIAPQLVRHAQEWQAEEGVKEPLWRTLTRLPGAHQEAVFAQAAQTYAFRAAELSGDKPDLEFVRGVMQAFEDDYREALLEQNVVVFDMRVEPETGAHRTVFITHDPTRPEILPLLRRLRLERYELQYAAPSAVRGVIERAFPAQNEYLARIEDEAPALDMGTVGLDDDEDSLIDREALEAELNRSSLINLFEGALVEAVRRGASDIHIYPNARKEIEIHFRIDGRLKLWMTERRIHPEAMLAVIKDNAMNVDRFEREMAQDGFIQRDVDGALIRYRVSVLPIANAQQELRSESVVIRVIDDRKVVTDLSKLGLLPSALERFDRAIRQPHGMVILTGPTGSGKSTTLVAALHQVVDPEVNVLTVEDPVEYIIPGVRQIKLGTKLNLEGALRAILRHDPDIVMVGEMRDRATAEMGIKLANTGHLTFSTLHTNDAPSAVTRLYKMGIEPFLIAYAINLVVAQRLIRTLCPDCKQVDDNPDPLLLERMGFTKDEVATTTFYRPSNDKTCPTCRGLGYKGRRAVCEALYFSRAIRHTIAQAQGNLDEGVLRDLAVKEGMLTLLDSAREYVKMGLTDVDEMMRVTATED
ncbi:MAG: GspE/PulE family protein [Bacteroidota bacterium]